MATERVEVARLKVQHTSTAEIEYVRQVVRAVKLCRRTVEADWDGTHIIFRAAWPKSGTHRNRAAESPE